MPRVPAPLGASPSPPAPRRLLHGARWELPSVSSLQAVHGKGALRGGPAAAALLLRDGGTCRQAWRPPVSPNQEGTPLHRGLTLPQAVRAVGWGLLQLAERVRPPSVTPARMPGQQWREKQPLAVATLPAQRWCPESSCAPALPTPPQHPSVAKLISKTQGAAPGCGQRHCACARSLVSTRPFPGALGGFRTWGDT